MAGMDRAAPSTHALDRELSAMTGEVRLDLLAERVCEHGALAVRHSSACRLRRRVVLHLDDGSIMELSLYWPVRTPVAAVESVRFDPRVGWVVAARSTGGDRVVYLAWSARISTAT
jgi:hypothetical protein